MACHARTIQALFLGGLVAASFMPGCKGGDTTSAAQQDGGLPDGDSALAHKLVEEEGAVVLDVRTPEEFAEGHIEGATLIPHSELTARMAEVDKLTGGDKQKAIVVYCKSGGRAGKAKTMLTEHGYGRVTNLGGYSDW